MRPYSLLFAAALSLAPAVGRAAPPSSSKLLLNATGKTVIRKVALGNDETVAIISRSGAAAVNDPVNMPPGVVPDFVAVTHDHHLDKAYAQQTRGVPSALQQPGAWTAGDLRITAVAGSHSTAPVRKERPEIVTYVYDVDGLRIAFFACNGQARLEPDQAAALGRVDVALITLQTGYGLSTAHAIELMRQLGARVVVPLSHNSGDPEYDRELLADALAGGKVETVNGELALSREDLAAAGQRVIHIAPTLAP